MWKIFFTVLKPLFIAGNSFTLLVKGALLELVYHYAIFFKVIACLQIFNWEYLVPYTLFCFVIYRFFYPEATSGFLYGFFHKILLYIFVIEITLFTGCLLNEVEYVEGMNFWTSFHNLYIEFFGNTGFLGFEEYPKEVVDSYLQAESSETSRYDNENVMKRRWYLEFSANPYYHKHYGLIDNPASTGYPVHTLILSIAAVIVAGSIGYHFF